MKKIPKKLCSVFVLVALVLSNFLPFMPMQIVYAEPNENNESKITLRLDNATVSGNVITFDVEGTNVTATASGTGYTFNGTNLEINTSSINNVKLTLGNTFDKNTMRIELHDGRVLAVNDNNEVGFGGLDFSNDNAPHLQVVKNGGNQTGGEDTQSFQGNGTSTLNYSINGVIEYTPGNGYDYGIGFRINNIKYRADGEKAVFTEDTAYERDEHGQLILDDNNQPIPVLDPETLQPMKEKTSLTIASDTIHYNYDTDTNKVNFVFTMAPGTLMTGLVINGQTINDLPDTAEELLACYTDHAIEIPVNNIAKADTYNIEITARYPNSNEEFLGNFLWDYNPQGYTGPEDKVLNATMEFVEAEYNGNKYTTPEQINALGGVYIWKDAPRKKTYKEEREGVGEAQFPVGTKLTVRIIPDAGYQLVSFGINRGVFETQEEIGTYTFEVQGGPFHLQAEVQQVDDVVKTTSEKVSAGAIELGEEESMAVGTARLDVKDIELTEEQISNFKEASTGYNIKSYLDISLFNTVYKGDESKSWDTQVKDLENEATIYLQLEDNVKGEDVVIVHEKHDGTYEIIPTEYLAEYNAIVFKTKSFSNYAIASKTITNNASNPGTGDNMMNYIYILGISIIGLALTGLYLKKKKYS